MQEATNNYKKYKLVKMLDANEDEIYGVKIDDMDDDETKREFIDRVFELFKSLNIDISRNEIDFYPVQVITGFEPNSY